MKIKIEHSIKIISEGNEKNITLDRNDRIILRLDNIVIDTEINYDGTPLIYLYPYSVDREICGEIVADYTAYAAADAAKIKLKILFYGITLLKEGRK